MPAVRADPDGCVDPAGEVLLPEARDLLARAARARERVRAAESVREIALGTVAGAGLDAGPAALSMLRDVHPGLRVRLHEAPITDPTGVLRERRVDLALTRLPFDTSGLAMRRLGTEPVVRCCPWRTRWRRGRASALGNLPGGRASGGRLGRTHGGALGSPPTRTPPARW